MHFDWYKHQDPHFKWWLLIKMYPLLASHFIFTLGLLDIKVQKGFFHSEAWATFIFIATHIPMHANVYAHLHCNVISS